VRILLDTHCWLWQILEPERLTASVQDMLSDGGNETYLSVASMWEIIIKSSIGKLTLPLPPGEYIPSRLAAFGDLALTVEQPHVLRVAHLPPYHKDPFDRLLIAQAQSEGMSILTADALVAQYDVSILWAGAGPSPR
jgi:PIN domain nuclease of toxin-antitoxin system